MSDLLLGSICLSDIPRSEMKKVLCKDGKEKIYLNVAVVRRKEKGKYGDTHFLTCAPKKEERKEDVNYIIGDLKEWDPTPQAPTAEQIAAAPPANDDDLPFSLRGVAA